MLTTQPNKLWNGKTDKAQPVKVIVPDQDGIYRQLATGINATEAKHAAMGVLLDAWKCNQEYPEVRFANDGSVFVGRQTAQDRVEYTRYARNEDGTQRNCGSCSCGPYLFENGMSDYKPVSLRRFMDGTVADYNACITPIK